MFRDVLLPIDLSQESSWRLTLPVAVDQVRRSDGCLHLMTVVPDFGMSIVGQFFPDGYEEKAIKAATEALHAFTRAHLADDGIRVQHIVAHGTVYEEIIQAAQRIRADLIVLSSHRPELEDYLLGPNAARVVRHSTCSVLVVRDTGNGPDAAAG